jgi:hypothetical protein
MAVELEPMSTQPLPAAFARFSKCAAMTIAAVALLVPCVLALYALGFSEHLAAHPWIASLRLPLTAIAWPWRFAAFAVLLAASAPMLIALRAAHGLFVGYAKGSVFTPEAAAAIRAVAVWLFVAAWMQPLATVGLSLAVSAANGKRALALSIGTDQLWLMVFALIVWGIARVMHAAALLAEDHAAIV